MFKINIQPFPFCSPGMWSPRQIQCGAEALGCPLGMEPPTAAMSPPCYNTTYDTHSKMLHSLLYNFGGGPVGGGPEGAMHSFPPPISPSAVTGVGSPIAAAGSPDLRPVVHRPRSGSVASLGSTGSSLRDSYSPSHDSTVSHDSLSRDSPASIGSSPSPSPPTHESSKLFGLLKGTMASPYGSFFTPPPPPPQAFQPPQQPSRFPRTWCVSRGASSAAASSPPPTPPTPSSLKRPLESDLPIDLSCKRPRSYSPLSSAAPAAPPPTVSYSPAVCPSSSESSGSILKSILCGRGSLFTSSLPSPPSSCLSSPPLSSSSSSSLSSVLSFRGGCSPLPATSPPPPLTPPSSRRPSTSSTASAASSFSSTIRTGCSNGGGGGGAARVALAKKMMLPVRARVSDWMLKLVQFARSQPEFTALGKRSVCTALLGQTWARLLLLFMAETNFEFAVTRKHTDISSNHDEDATVRSSSGVVSDGWDSECPTMQSVQAIQTFITKCQMLTLDPREYHWMRMAVLFQNGEHILFYYKSSPVDHHLLKRVTPSAIGCRLKEVIYSEPCKQWKP